MESCIEFVGGRQEINEIQFLANLKYEMDGGLLNDPSSIARQT
jgi:hypothetical protein